MGEATKGETSEIEHLSAQTSGYPIDLLQRFSAGNHRPTEFAARTEDAGEIELNLGLSLGGYFGVGPKEKNLIRSSSVAGLTSLFRDDEVSTPPPVSSPGITRTCSLPTEAEEELTKRKQLQSLRRMEAKRKRLEKQRSFRAGKYRTFMEGSCEQEKRVEEEGLKAMDLKGKVEGSAGCPGSTGSASATEQQQYMVANGLYASLAPPFPLPAWVAPTRGASLPPGFDIKTNGKGNVLAAAAAALRGFPPSSSQGSLGSHSQGSSSSGISEFESLHVQGLSSSTEARSPASVQSLSEQSEQKTVVTHGTTTTTETSGKLTGVDMEKFRKPKVVDNGVIERNMMEEMPCVSTKGDGPDGRRIEGFLYKYRKGEEVRIVCVCHGSFLSPAEFVKHAGGGDVAHPLRHIVVNPSSSFS